MAGLSLRGIYVKLSTNGYAVLTMIGNENFNLHCGPSTALKLILM